MDRLQLTQSLSKEDRGPTVLSLALFFTILALLFVLARVHVRVWVKQAFGWDDGVMIFATVINLPIELGPINQE